MELWAPLSAFDLVLAGVAIGLFMGQQAALSQAKWLAVVGGAGVVGFVLRRTVPDLPFAWSDASLMLLTVTGFAVAAKVQPPPGAGATYGALVGAVYGLAVADELLYAVPLEGALRVFGSLLLVSGPAWWLVKRFDGPGASIAVRVLGSWIATAGILLSAFFIGGG